MKFILLLISFISLVASANPLTDCERRMSNPDRVHALIHILDTSVTNGVLKRRALEVLVKDFKNPFPAASEHVLRDRYQEIFDEQTHDFSNEDVNRLQAALAAHLEGMAATDTISWRASEVTREVFAPKVLRTLRFFEGYGKSERTPEVVGTFQGRPAVVLFQIEGFDAKNEIYIVLCDPFNPDEQKRIIVKRAPQDFILGLAGGNLSIENVNGEDYLVRWDSRRVIDLKTMRKVSYTSLDFGAGHTIRQYGGSLASIDGITYGGYFSNRVGAQFSNLDTLEKYPLIAETWSGVVPKPLMFKACGKPVAAIPNGRQGLAVVDIQNGNLLVIHDAPRDVQPLDFLNPGLVSIGGIPWIYLREPKPEQARGAENEVILMMSAVEKKTRRIDLGRGTSNVSTVKYRGKDYLLWFESHEGIPHLLDPTLEQPVPAEPLGIQAFSVYPFEYGGELRAFAIGHFGVSVVAISHVRPSSRAID